MGESFSISNLIRDINDLNKQFVNIIEFITFLNKNTKLRHVLNIRNNGKKKNTGFVLEESRIDYYGKEIITYDVNTDFISDHLEEFIKFLEIQK